MTYIPSLARPILGSGIALMALAACSPGSTTNAANESANAVNMAQANMTDASMAGTNMASANDMAPGASRTAPLVDSKGATIGEVTLSQNAGGVRLALTGRDLPAGVHGFHIHMTGKCDAPEFTTAGGHWNPAAHEHGLENPKGAHAGDLPNLTVAANGTVSFDTVLTGLTLRGGASPVFDTDGAAVMIHADPDDEKTDPSGNSGKRIACAPFPAS